MKLLQRFYSQSVRTDEAPEMTEEAKINIFLFLFAMMVL